MYSFFTYYLPEIRAHVSLSAGFPGGLCFLGHPAPSQYPVDTCSRKGELRGSYFVPGIRFAQTVEWHYPPGFVVVKTGQSVRCQHLSLSCFGPSPSVRVRGLVHHNGGSTVPLLSLLMVCLLTGSFSVGLRIPRISPILASFGLSGRGLWAMHFPVHLRGWELSLAARVQHRIPSCSSQFHLFGNMVPSGLTSQPEKFSFGRTNRTTGGCQRQLVQWGKGWRARGRFSRRAGNW